jgi:hypothetical protein
VTDLRAALLPACVGLAACGASPPRADDGAESSIEGTRPIALEALIDPPWNARAHAVLERFGGVRAKDRVTTIAAVEGRDARIVFEVTQRGLRAVRVAWTAPFAGMDACASAWSELRKRIDAVLGESGADNLSAAWDSRRARAELACDPEESGGALLHLQVERPR